MRGREGRTLMSFDFDNELPFIVYTRIKLIMNKKFATALSLFEMQKLVELGFDSEILNENLWTAQDLLDLLPTRIEDRDMDTVYTLDVWPDILDEDGIQKKTWTVAYIPDYAENDVEFELQYFSDESLLKCSFEMVVWAKKNNFI